MGFFRYFKKCNWRGGGRRHNVPPAWVRVNSGVAGLGFRGSFGGSGGESPQSLENF